MEQQYFEPGDRVIARRKIKPFRQNGAPMIRPRTLGTIETLSANMAFVTFDTLACPVHVRLSDINLISNDEMFVLSVGFWPNGGPYGP